MNSTEWTRKFWEQSDRIFWAGLVLGLGLSWWYATNQIVEGDQTQMIHKGYLGAYQGVWMSFGNAASVVGNVPGSVLAWVVGGPLFVWDSPYAPMLFLLLLRLAGFLMLDAVVRRVFPGSGLARLSFLLLCWLNPWFLFDSLLYNPAYLIFCAGLHCWTAWHMQHERRLLMTVLHVLSIGLAMQLHFSWPVLVFLSALMFYRGVLKVSWVGVLIATALIVVSLVPYLMQLWADPSLAHNPDPDARKRFIGWGALNVYPVLKAVLYWLRYGSWAFPSKLVNDTEFLWVGVQLLPVILENLWKIFMGLIGAVTVIIAAVANLTALSHIRPRLKRSAGTPVEPLDWMLLYSTAAFIAALISAGLAPIVFNYWHLTLIFPFALFPVIFWVTRYLGRSAQREARPVLAVAAFLVFINVVAINDSEKFSYAADYAQQTIEYVEREVGPRVR